MAVLDGKYGFATLHAAAVEQGGAGILLLGKNGSGKTSAALSLVEQLRFRLVSDNFVPCNGEHVLGFPGWTRQKGLSLGVPADPLDPFPGRARLCAVVMMIDRECRTATQTQAARCLEDYVAVEREDHRDSEVFAYLSDSLGWNSSMNKVIARLSNITFMTCNWREQSIVDLVRNLSL